MSWIGQWKNEYGSILHITDDNEGAVKGTFHSALEDSVFAGQEAKVTGLHQGICIQFAFAHAGPIGDTIASFTGLMRDGKLKTVWHVVSDRAMKSPHPGLAQKNIQLPWAHAVQTNFDTFELID